MIEMLVVLVIVAILSIAATVGFNMAMNAHKANVLLNDVRLMAVTVIQKSSYTINADGTIDTSEVKPDSSYPLSAFEWHNAKDLIAIVADDVPKSVCQSVLVKAGNAYTIFVVGNNGEEVQFTGDTNICDKVNQMQFLFNISGACESSCLNCCHGVCCADDEFCYEATAQCEKKSKCDWDIQNLCGDTCCDKANSCCGNAECCVGRVECCSGKCCPEGQTCIDGACACPGGKEYVGGLCVCPEGTIEINGVCLGVECYKAGSMTEKCTSNGNCDCYVGTERCGGGCSGDGLSCAVGMCTNQCGAGTEYAYNPGPNLFGCLSNHRFAGGGTSSTADDVYQKVNCTHSASLIFCYIQGTKDICGHSRCGLNGKGCSYGACDETTCAPEKGYNIVKVSTTEFNQANYVCSDGTHYCASMYCSFSDGVVCAQGCTNNDYDKCTQNQCTGGCQFGTYDAEKKACCDGSLCCRIGVGYGHYCSYNDKICGYFCTDKNALGDGCTNGTCKASDCTSVGLQWVNNQNYNYGCYDSAMNILCQMKGRNVFSCFNDIKITKDVYTGTLCGSTCTDYKASGCAECFSGEDLCPGGTLISSSNSMCRYDGNLECYFSSNGKFDCRKNGFPCGVCENSNGTNCMGGGQKSYCSIDDCAAGEDLLYDSSKTSYPYYCGVSSEEVLCSNGTCKLDGKQCGIGCNDDGSSCTVGICLVSECGKDLSLTQVTHQYYGCYNKATGTKCYQSNGLYRCYKNGLECGLDCQIDGTGCATGQTCVEN